MAYGFVAGQVLTADDLNGLLPQGVIAVTNDETTATTSGTTELVVIYLNFTARADRRYKLEFGSVGQGTVDTDAFRVRLRYEATAGALTASGTAFLTRDINGFVRAMPGFYTASVTGLTAQAYAIGVTVVRTSGTGTYSFNGSANSQQRLELYDVGPA
jgi:hypothetical protein